MRPRKSQSNILRGDAPTVYWNELSDLKGKDALILDVRTEKEVSAGAVPGAKHIPLNELRDRLNELPRDAVVYSYCQAGLRSCIATRILLRRVSTPKT
jgi:rhodanese-related sulfurtransferase